MKNKTIRTVTAAELIEALQMLPEDALVAFSSNYGDRCRTRQVHTLDGQIEEEELYETAYSDSGFAVVKERDEEESEKETPAQKVWIIS